MKTTKPKTRSKTARQSLPPGTKIGGNGKIHFGLKDTPAHEVFVAGDFNGWNPAALRLECNGDGCWSAEIEVPPGRHE
jgi:1,4-alpha-glucan branching enzyme